MKIKFKALLILVLCLNLSLPVGAVMPAADAELSIGSCSVSADTDTLARGELPVLSYTHNGVTAYSDAEVYHDTMAAFVNDLRGQMVERKNTVVIGYKTTTLLTQDFYDELADMLSSHTGDPKEGDYLWFTLDGYNASSSGIAKNNAYYYTFTFNITYYTTAAQEAEVDAAVEGLAGQLMSSCSSDYEIVKAIYEYMCGSIAYDNTHLYDSSYKLKYSAYAALINKTAVCQGYANLFYRLALECGIDSRIISGYSNNTSHAWNIVKLDGYYYNLDATWDSSFVQSGSDFEYFLRCDRTFSDHTPSDGFTTEEFITAYPKASADYDASNPAHRHEYSGWFVDKYATQTSAGEKSRYCSCGTRSDVTAIPYVDFSTVYKNYTEKSWSKNGINFVSSNSLMGDTGNGDFEQTATMTRAMFVTVLWRLAGKPETSGENVFTDLSSKQTWYHDAVIWAHEKGIVNGTGANKFSPNGEVTREQIATFLYRYVTKHLRDDASESMRSISSFPDSDKVGKFAVDALSWAYGAKLITGQKGAGGISYLAPKANASREEVAVIIARFCGQN